MKRLLIFSTVIIAVSISVQLVNSRYRQDSLRCSLDGSRIIPRYEVEVIKKDKSISKFSCIVSAQIWLTKNSKKVFYILVTDEVTSKKIRAENAYYVTSEVITTPHTSNAIHAFGQKNAAESHALTFNGKRIKNPFRYLKRRPVKLAKILPDSGQKCQFLCPSSYKSFFLITTAALIHEQNVVYIFHNYLTRFSKVFLNPPDKPPMDSANSLYIQTVSYSF